MALQKRLDYGFNGYQVPPTPRGCRSARGKKRSLSRKIENDQMCAFELLAAVAGKLLQEGESSPVSSKVCAERAQPTITKNNVKKEQLGEEKIQKVEPCDQGSCDESVFIAEPDLQGHSQNHSHRKFSHSQKNVSLGYASNSPQKVSSVEESTIGKSKSNIVKSTSKVERDHPRHAESYKGKVDGGYGARKIGCMSGGSAPDMYNYEDPMEFDIKPPALVSSDSSVEVPSRKDPIPSGPFPRRRDETKVVNGDDDENSSGSTQPSTVTMKTSKAPLRIGEWRARKLLRSRYWKVAPKLKDHEFSNRDGEMRPVFRNRKTSYTRERSQNNFPFKRRKLFHQYSASTSDHGISSEGISSSPKKSNEGHTIGSGSGTSSSAVGEQSSFLSGASQVKLCIKSFKIPELFIEIPETATVGSLKRTVMEAVTAILGGGLRVGVLLQGKKVQGDNRTLVQTGICHDNQLDGLGFALEPNTTPVPAALSAEDSSFLLPCHTPQPLNRYPVTPTIEPGTSDVSLTTTTNVSNCVESDHDSVPTSVVLANKTASDSRALVPIPSASVEALAVVPLNRKSRRSELVQRRIRRPFSVSEVEALVQAVEKLGTGRWRDVKLRAFDNAKHRTYVDLKDKWKTLVHTARISPQQRRGEPVPQELLDRVLAAHAYWSQQQAKHQIKQ